MTEIERESNKLLEIVRNLDIVEYNIKQNFIPRYVLDNIRQDIERWCAPYTYYNHKVIDKKEVLDIIDKHINMEEKQ